MTDEKAVMMKSVRGMLHVHSNYSYDGDNSIAEISFFFKSKGYHFVCLTEHGDDFTQDKMDAFFTECEANSRHDFIVIPGIEYRCNDEIHLLVIGSKKLYQHTTPLEIVATTHAENILTIIAHPRHCRKNPDRAMIELVNGMELWNGHKDSKIIPHYHTYSIYNQCKKMNSRLLALGGSDLHSLANYFPLDTVIPSCALEAACILDRLKSGDFYIQGRFFRIQSPSLTRSSFIFLVLGRYMLMLARALRDGFRHKGQDVVQDV